MATMELARRMLEYFPSMAFVVGSGAAPCLAVGGTATSIFGGCLTTSSGKDIAKGASIPTVLDRYLGLYPNFCDKAEWKTILHGLAERGENLGASRHLQLVRSGCKWRYAWDFDALN